LVAYLRYRVINSHSGFDKKCQTKNLAHELLPTYEILRPVVMELYNLERRCKEWEQRCGIGQFGRKERGKVKDP